MSNELSGKGAGSPPDVQLHSLILREMAEGVVLVRDRDGIIVYANPRFEQLLGYEPGELTGRYVGIVNKENAERTPEQTAQGILDQLRRHGEATYEIENVRKDGTALWSRVRTCELIHPEHGRLYLAVHEDVTARKEAERRLHEKERLLRTVVQLMPVGIWIAGADGEVHFANSAARQLWGGEAPAAPDAYDFSGARWADSGRPVAPEDWALTRALRRGETTLRELLLIRTTDGQTRTVLNSALPLEDDRGRIYGALAVVEDLTPLKEAEARFSGIVSTASDGILLLDQQLRMAFLNPGAARLFGYEAGELLGAPVELLFPERLRASYRSALAGIAQEREATHTFGDPDHLVARRKDGSELPVEAVVSTSEANGRFLTLMIHDVTQRLKAEERQRFLAEAGGLLASSLDYERSLSHIAELGVRMLGEYCVVDLLEGETTLRKRKVAVGGTGDRRLAELLEGMPIDMRRPFLSAESLRTGKPVLYTEVNEDFLAAHSQEPEHLRVLRLIRPASLLTVPLVARGKTRGALVFLRTAQCPPHTVDDLELGKEYGWRAAVALDNALLLLDARASSRERERLMSIVAHDLRSPLNAIALSAAMVQQHAQRGELREEDVGTLGAVQRTVKRMDRLIEDLLDLARLESGRLVVSTAAEPAEHLLSEAYDAGKIVTARHALTLRSREALPAVRCDRDRILQVFTNLIGNAGKFAPPGTKILLGAELHGDEVWFWVADEGPGIAPEAMPHLFELGWQGRHNDRRGAGIGLSICKGIVEAHGGRIWAESRLGVGTTFLFTLPVAATSASLDKARAGAADTSTPNLEQPTS